MKKLALLLGALSLVSSAAYAKEVVPVVEEVTVVEEAPVEVSAAPALTVTYVGQSIEVDNTSGAEDIGEGIHFGNSVGLAYGDDWTFDFFARKTWSMDTDKGIHSNGHRLQLDAWKKINDNLAFGVRYRGQSTYDRYYLRTKYSYGAFSGWIDTAYQSNNGEKDKEDAYYVEAMPVAVTVGPVTLGYYFEADTWAVNTKEDGFEHKYRQQLRASAPLYTGEKLNVGLEYRWQFDTDVDYDTNIRKTPWTEANENSHIVVLSADYALTDNLSVNGYYQYDMYDFDSKNGNGAAVDSDKYYGEFCVGWTYTF